MSFATAMNLIARAYRAEKDGDMATAQMLRHAAKEIDNSDAKIAMLERERSRSPW